jgi:hypothetical protein
MDPNLDDGLTVISSLGVNDDLQLQPRFDLHYALQGYTDMNKRGTASCMR